jgi:hypothetical protein
MSAPLWPGALAAGLVTVLAIAFMWAENEWEVMAILVTAAVGAHTDSQRFGLWIRLQSSN